MPYTTKTTLAVKLKSKRVAASDTELAISLRDTPAQAIAESPNDSRR